MAAQEKKGPPLRKDSSWYTTNGSFVNKLIFPAPEPSYTKNSFQGQLIWVPKQIEDALEFSALRDDQVIPCLLIRNYVPNCNYLMIYLHGNAADLGRCRSLCLAMMKMVGCHILAVEYPGYGIFPGWPCEESVTATAEQVYDWVVSPYGMSWPPNQIIVMGRSIGSGPAVNLTQQIIKPMVPPPSYKEKKKPARKSIWSGISNFFDASCVADHTTTSRTVSTANSQEPQPQVEEEEPTPYIEYPDPFLSVQHSDTMIINLLTKAQVPFDENWPKETLIRIARENDLIPPLEVCLRSNKTLKCALLVLYAPFESISHVVSSYAGDWASYLVSNRFRNVDKIKNISCPLLVIHSDKDEIIPIQQGENIVREAQRHYLNVRFHRISDLLHNETNVSRDICKPIKAMLDVKGGEYVRWEPPEMVFRAPISTLEKNNEMKSRSGRRSNNNSRNNITSLMD